MATKQQIFEKIAELLDDINSQYQTLERDGDSQDSLKADLFEATVNYFAAHAALYNKMLKKDAPGVSIAEPNLQDIEKDDLEDESEDKADNDQDEAEKEESNGQSAEIIFTPAIDATVEKTIHAEQVEEVSSENDEGNGQSDEKEENEDEVDTDEADELVYVADADDTTDEDDEPHEEEKVTDEEDDIVEGENDVELDDSEDNSMPEQAPKEEQVSDIPTPTTSQEANEKMTTEVANGVVNEVTIAEKEVHVANTDLPQQPPVEAAKPSRPLSINEMMSAQRKTGTNPLFAARRGDTERVTDIKTAISLNDKLLFIKDLFNGYSLAYSEAIELLNRYDDFASAEAFLQANYAEKNNWADKQTTVDKLHAVMRKRFG